MLLQRLLLEHRCTWILERSVAVACAHLWSAQFLFPEKGHTPDQQAPAAVVVDSTTAAALI